MGKDLRECTGKQVQVHERAEYERSKVELYMRYI